MKTPKMIDLERKEQELWDDYMAFRINWRALLVGLKNIAIHRNILLSEEAKQEAA